MGALIDPAAIRKLIQEVARAEGFARTRVARAARAPHFAVFRNWLSEGRHGRLDYLERSSALREDPSHLLPGVRSVVVLAYPHSSRDPVASDGTRTARYALSEDYHRTLRRKCAAILAAVRRETGDPVRARICVDSAPLNERDWAAAAGIGWIGKNGMVLNENEGSYLLLCEILLDLELTEDSPVEDRCGSCVRCLKACPTDAFVSPGLLDSRRCLSYWTIEQRGVIPDEIVSRLNGRLFGCDICQEVCPYNRPVPTAELDRRPPTAREMLETGSGEWKRRFASTPLARAGAAGMRRNAAALAAFSRRADLAPRLEELRRSSHPVVAAQARAALERIGEEPR